MRITTNPKSGPRIRRPKADSVKSKTRFMLRNYSGSQEAEFRSQNEGTSDEI